MNSLTPILLTLGLLLVCGIMLALAAIATSTAPAATFTVIYQCGARGSVSSTLLEVTAVDDALGIIVFALMLI